MNHKFKKKRFMNVVFYLRKNRSDKNGLGVIYWYLSFGGQESKPYSSEIKVYPKNWRKGKITGNNAKPYNDALDNVRADITNVFNECKSNFSHIQEIAEKYKGTIKQDITFLELYDMLVERKILEKKKPKTIETYETFRKCWLKRYLKSIKQENLLATQFTHIHLEGIYEMMLNSEGVESGEYIKHQLSKVRATIQLGYSKGIIEKDAVAKYKIHIPTDKKEYVYLEISEIEALERLEFLPQESHLKRTRDLFLLQCYTGLAYSDLGNFNNELHLSKKLDWKWIFKNRVKTDISQYIPLLPEPIKVLERLDYDTKPPLGHLYNQRIRICASRAGIKKYLVSHYGRNSLGAYLINKGVQLQFVSRVLGHKSINTTQRVYAKVIDTWGLKDEFNRVFRNQQPQKTKIDNTQNVFSTGKISFTYSYSN
ncbi:site-specific integrase [Bernardetia sp. OM2101]|uniref:site-specific integrase n=1 Tax=Bernardetia sp. OM2101 TaxID=3344876 RepID=UPI0035D07865